MQSPSSSRNYSSRSSRSSTPTPVRRGNKSSSTAVAQKKRESRNSSPFRSNRAQRSNAWNPNIFRIAYLIALISIFIIYLPPDQNSKFCPKNQSVSIGCVPCPENGKCIDGNLECLYENETKFFRICHKPGKIVTEENLSLLYEYQKQIYQIADSKMTTVQDILDNESFQFNQDDIEIIWTYDYHYYIGQNGALSFRLSSLGLITIILLLSLPLIVDVILSNAKENYQSIFVF